MGTTVIQEPFRDTIPFKCGVLVWRFAAPINYWSILLFTNRPVVLYVFLAFLNDLHRTWMFGGGNLFTECPVLRVLVRSTEVVAKTLQKRNILFSFFERYSGVFILAIQFNFRTFRTLASTVKWKKYFMDEEVLIGMFQTLCVILLLRQHVLEEIYWTTLHVNTSK